MLPPTISDGGIMVSRLPRGRSSVNTYFALRDISLFSVRIQWNLPQIFIAWVGIAENTQPPRTHSASTYLILQKSSNPRRSYLLFKFVQFVRRPPCWICPEVDFHDSRPQWPIVHQRTKFKHKQTMRCWVIYRWFSIF